MKPTTVVLDEATARELQLLAQREKLPVAALLRDGLGRYLSEAKRGDELRLRFLGTGRSAHHDCAERAEDLLWGDVQPTLPLLAGKGKEVGGGSAASSPHRTPLYSRGCRR